MNNRDSTQRRFIPHPAAVHIADWAAQGQVEGRLTRWDIKQAGYIYLYSGNNSVRNNHA